MATFQHRKQLSRLDIAQPFQPQQPFTVENPHLFSPALASGNRHGFPMPLPSALQTPMQSSFFPIAPPGAPPRMGHRTHGSMAQLPLSNGPMTPLGRQDFASMQRLPQFTQPGGLAPGFVPRSRRTTSLSIGGPPKAPLGGPQRRPSPLPEQTPDGNVVHQNSEPKYKGKKIIVNIPKEVTEEEEQNHEETRSFFLRRPIPKTEVRVEELSVVPETTSCEEYPPQELRMEFPDSLDVFLPGQVAWDAYKRAVVDQRLKNLGFEDPGFNPINAMQHVPAIGTSTSSPADPNVLMYKLDKLQRSQSISNASSPVPRSLSSSPGGPIGQRFMYPEQDRSDYSGSPMPWGPGASRLHPHSQNLPAPVFPRTAESLISSPGISTSASSDVFRSSIPYTQSAFLVPGGTSVGSSRPSSRPDFTIGFGLDIPEEDEELEAEHGNPLSEVPVPRHDDVLNTLHPEIEDGEPESGQGSFTYEHSRHASHATVRNIRTSQAEAELRSTDIMDDSNKENIPSWRLQTAEQSITVPGRARVEERGTAEWTDSEDLVEDGSDAYENKSDSEWSNPSDEERHRRSHIKKGKRKSLSGDAASGIPRHIPEFPQPPDTADLYSGRLNSHPDDEVLSNPSEEAFESSPRARRPLPPIPGSRHPSGNIVPPHPVPTSAFHPKDGFVHSRSGSQIDPTRSTSLNPLAKPFVFGGVAAGSGNSNPPPRSESGSISSMQLHNRTPSFGRALNAAAKEFKPGSFTFRPPPGVPSISFPDPEQRRSLTSLPEPEEDGRALQGREKRMRRESDISSVSNNDVAVERPGQDNLATFKFPSQPNTPQKHADGPSIPVLHSRTPSTVNDVSEDVFNSVPIAQSPVIVTNDEVPPPRKVPAALFQSFVQTDSDGGLRSAGRSRLNSKDAFQDLSRRPSLDDRYVPSISRKASRLLQPANETTRHAPSFSRDSVSSAAPLAPASLNRVEDIIGGKMEELKKSIVTSLSDSASLFNASALSTISNRLASIIEIHLSKHGISLRDGRQIGDQGDADLEAIREVLEDGHAQILAKLDASLSTTREQSPRRSLSPLPLDRSPRQLEEAIQRAIVPVVVSANQVASRLEALEAAGRGLSDEQREIALHDVMGVIIPRLEELRAEPIDFEYLTAKLSSAVRPHIHELIDLTSDKKETATLIVQHLAPVLQTLASATRGVDIEMLTSHISNELNRLAPVLDNHIVKEEVADLVVERLDARLSVRDRSHSPEVISSKISEVVTSNVRFLQPLIEQCQSAVQTLTEKSSRTQEVQANLAMSLQDLPASVQTNASILLGLEKNLAGLVQAGASTSEHLTHLSDSMSKLDDLVVGQGSLAAELQNVSGLQAKLGSQLLALPNTMSSAFEGLQASVAELIDLQRSQSSTETHKALLEANIDLQAQLEKLREQLMSTSSQKDALSRKLETHEQENSNLHSSLEAVCRKNKDLEVEISVSGSRASELEEALSAALSRLKASDVTTQTDKERINQLETATRELSSEKGSLKSKVDSLERQNEWAIRDLESVKRELAHVQRDRDNLASQQDYLEDLRRNSEQLDNLAKLITSGENRELEDLRRQRDRAKILEGEHAALQKRHKEQETKLSTLERGSLSMRQNVADANKRCVDLEHVVQDKQSQIAALTTRLEHLEVIESQQRAQISLMKSEREEVEAALRSEQTRVQQAQEEAEALREQLSKAQASLNEVKNTSVDTWRGQVTNGTLPRSESRLNAVPAPSRTPTPTATPVKLMSRQASSAYTPSIRSPPNSTSVSNTSTWDSMHAPPRSAEGTSTRDSMHAPRPTSVIARPSDHRVSSISSINRKSVASPIPSVVSVAPSQHDDGWWS
ncbi:hypothetical protein SISSUDRAFT_1058314 [Sistotremastrum suecicum HHB10207 ss-3]|uniref:Uncharacterized protein n=1 Tax=Sistotremastrum suecicum HHB10207 ss-3 TaxID=1314776 RepID=A0A166HLR9_9AGAM|nr:hypothetical protein SISSUDRAFT_1058314 [Sistotremastrum suecicum HHB10207 ss-3]